MHCDINFCDICWFRNLLNVLCYLYWRDYWLEALDLFGCMFKQQNTRIFTTLFHPQVFLQYLNNVIRTTLPNRSFFFCILWFCVLWDNYKFWRGQNEFLWGLNFFFFFSPKILRRPVSKFKAILLILLLPLLWKKLNMTGGGGAQFGRRKSSTYWESVWAQ